MSMMGSITKSKVRRPFAGCVYAPPGTGKTFFGTKTVNPIFICAEEGADAYDVAKFGKISGYNDVVACVDSLLNEEHEYKTLVIDTIDAVENMIHDLVKRESGVASIELACGGYGKGYVRSAEKFMALTKKLDELRDKKKMNILVLSHSSVNKFFDPMTGVEHDTYRMKLHKRAVPVWIEWLDFLFFADFETFHKKASGNKDFVFGAGERVMYTEKRPGFDAKNRFSMPFQMPFSFDVFQEHLEKFYAENGSVDVCGELHEAIMSRIELLKDKEIVKKVLEATAKAVGNEAQLKAILGRLNQII